MKKNELTTTKHLYYVLKNMETDLNSMKRGAGVPHVSGEAISKIMLAIQDALRLSEENAPWKEFMYYYAREGDLTSTNQVFLPIKDTGMQLEIWYERIHTDPEYIEPIEKAVLYDAEGNEYEFFSEEARDILRKGESES